MIRRPPRSTLSSSSAASDVYKRQHLNRLSRTNLAENEEIIFFLLNVIIVIGRKVDKLYFFLFNSQRRKYRKKKEYDLCLMNTAIALEFWTICVLLTVKEIRIWKKTMGKKNEPENYLQKKFKKKKQIRGGTITATCLKQALTPSVTIGPDGIITDVNSATEKATGLPREKIIGTDFSEYFTEPDKARVGYKQVFDIGKVVDYELYLKHINGSSIPVLYNASVYKDNESVSYTHLTLPT